MPPTAMPSGVGDGLLHPLDLGPLVLPPGSCRSKGPCVLLSPAVVCQGFPLQLMPDALWEAAPLASSPQATGARAGVGPRRDVPRSLCVHVTL